MSTNDGSNNNASNSVGDAPRLATILAPFNTAKAILRDAVQPAHVLQVYLRNYMRLLGLWPARRNVERRAYYGCNVLIMSVLHVFVLTIACDLYEASVDIVLLGEDLVVTLGLSLILFKLWFVRHNSAHLDAILSEFGAFHALYARRPWQQRHQPMRRCQRNCFLAEFVAFFGFLILGTILCTAMILQPLFSADANALPFRAQFPFNLTDRAQHPHAYVAIYTFQCGCLAYMLVAIVVMDMMGSQSISQTAVNLRVLCLRIRQLGCQWQQLPQNVRVSALDRRRELHAVVQFHQRIIRIKERINDIYYWNYVAQMGASTFMICLTAFEVLLAQDQPLVAIKFFVYMISAFLQLLYWCYVGNVTYFDVRTPKVSL